VDAAVANSSTVISICCEESSKSRVSEMVGSRLLFQLIPGCSAVQHADSEPAIDVRCISWTN